MLYLAQFSSCVRWTVVFLYFSDVLWTLKIMRHLYTVLTETVKVSTQHFPSSRATVQLKQNFHCKLESLREIFGTGGIDMETV